MRRRRRRYARHTRPAPVATDLKVGDPVIFGRRNGEQTRGTVTKINGKTVGVRQDEERGSRRVRFEGTVWRVAKSLVRKDPSRSPEAPTAPKASRTEDHILREIRDVHCQLSPENLTCDGELSGTAVRRKATALRRQLKALETELGRTPTNKELWAW